MERRLYRSNTDRYIGGVCGGLTEYFNVDPALIRIVFVLLLFASGFGLLTYLVMWIAIRKRPMSELRQAPASGQAADPCPQPTAVEHPSWTHFLPGAILILVGVIFLIHENWWWFDLDYYFERFWPLLLIGLGILLVVYRGRSESAPVNSVPPTTQPHNGGASV